MSINHVAEKYLAELAKSGMATHSRVRHHERNTGGQVIEETTTNAAEYLKSVTLKLKSQHPDLPKRYDATEVPDQFVLSIGRKYFVGTRKDGQLVWTFDIRLAATYNGTGAAAQTQGVLQRAGFDAQLFPAPTNPNRSSL